MPISPERITERQRFIPTPENAATRFMREFKGKPAEFNTFLGAERFEGKLSNEMSVVLLKKPGAKINLTVAIVGGARFDPDELQGRAHFNEHMILAGTHDYPRKDLLVKPIENEGGYIGAQTSSNMLTLNVGINDPKDLPLAMALASQCFTQSLYGSDTIETERKVIIQEITSREANPANQLSEEYKRVFFPDTPLGRPILGSKESVTRLTRKQLIEHGQEMFVGRKMELVVSGNISIERLMEQTEQAFGSLPIGDKTQKLKILPSPKQDDGIIIHPYTDTEKVFFHLGFPTVQIYHPDSYVLYVIKEVLGGGRTSLLNQKLRYAKDTGWVYGINAHSYQFSDAGTFTIETSTTKEHLQKVIDVIITLYHRIRQDGLTQEEVEFAQNKIIKTIMGGYETASAWVKNHAGTTLMSDLLPYVTKQTLIYPIYDYTEQLAKVTSEDTKRVANQYFKEWRFAACGNITRDDLKINF